MRWTAVTAATMVAAVVAVACDGESTDQPSDGDKQPEPTSKAAAFVDPDAEPPAPRIPDAERGGTLRITTRQVPETFDPTRSSYVDTAMVLRLVTRALTQYRYDPETQKMVLVPDLATDLGQPNDDFTEWTFQLRQGVRYEDGTPVRAEDVAYAIRRQFAQDELGGGGPVYGRDYFLGGAEYPGPFKAAEAGGEDEFEGVETPDDRTVVIKMRRPFPDMRFYASFPNFSPIPAEQDTGEDYGQRPLATGPYKFEEYTPSEELVLTRNAEWDPGTDPGRHQYVDEFHFEYGQDPIALQEDLIADEGPSRNTATYDDLLANVLGEVEREGAMQRVARAPRSCMFYAYMDTRKIPLEVRRALALAYPIDELNEAAGYIPELTAAPATTILPSTVPGHIEHDAVGRGGGGPPQYDQAREMLAEAGYEGFEIATYFASDDPIQQQVAQVREKELERAGFKVKSIGVPAERMRELLGDPRAPVNLRTEGWCADWPSGGSVFPAQWDPRNTDADGVPNPSFLTDEEIGREIDRISRLPADQANTAWGELDKKLMEEHLPVIPLSRSSAALLHGSHVRNYQIDELLGTPDLTAVYLAP